MSKTLLIGTRPSPLAIIQTNEVVDWLKNFYPDLTFDIVEINSVGDRNPDASIRSLGKGIFVKEIEQALIDKRIDVAVHSLKDLPVDDNDLLTSLTVCPREDSRDVFISKFKCDLSNIPTGSIIGTSSPRRKVQILAVRPDIVVSEMRGNVGTRLSKIGSSDYDGIVVAAAGINRLGYGDYIDQYLDTNTIIPEPGQGALAVQFRNENTYVQELCIQIEDSDTKIAITEERNFVKEVGGGCKVPIAAHVQVNESMVVMNGMMVCSNGIDLVKECIERTVDESHAIGNILAKNLLSKIY
ncbi:MAG: hydroxymethylbilane synthase [Dehalococcoidia bacterium]|nr:hydroxymethylbilane synthase [Dehalococcoidia bacterium]